MLNLLRFNHLSEFKAIEHGVTARTGGESQNTYASLNLSYSVGDNSFQVEKNRSLVATEFGISSDFLFFPQQCHTGNVKTIGPDTRINDLENTDALICSIPNIAIGVLAADCIPILFYDPVNHVAAAAHAGWRGTEKEIGPCTVAAMRQQFSTELQHIRVGIGPGISMEKYEVGPEVVQALSGRTVDIGPFSKAGAQTGKFHVDLQGFNKAVLMGTGIPSENIEILDLCTYQNPKLFFSARRDGFETGRFGAVIKLKDS